MKNKILSIAMKCKNAFSIVACGCLCLCIPLVGQIAFAADAKSLFSTVVKVLGGLTLASAAYTGVTGGIAYGEASAEGEGPEMSKAQRKLKAAVLLAIIGAALSLGANNLASFITSVSF